ncbi:Uncharacterised protein [Yersinia enterocolitica]|nr:Uncharacterised protein [Yersinia enterocolitica]
MSPSEFIHKHILVALVADGVPDVIAKGGQTKASSTITNSLRQAARVPLSTIVCGKRVCGFSSIVRKPNASRAGSGNQSLRFSSD